MKAIKIILCLCFISLGIKAQDSSFLQFPVFNFKQATEKIFDAKASGRNEFLWKPNYAEMFDFMSCTYKDGFCHTKLDTAMMYKCDGLNYTVMAYSTLTYIFQNDLNGVRTNKVMSDCHGCMPVISIAIWCENSDKSTTLLKFKKAFTSFGDMGISGTYNLEKVGKEQFALTMESGYMGQGEYENTKTWYSLNGFPKTLFSNSNTGDLNTGAKMATSVKAIPFGNSPFYDLVLTTNNNGKIKKETYRYSTGGEYKLVKGK